MTGRMEKEEEKDVFVHSFDLTLIYSHDALLLLWTPHLLPSSSKGSVNTDLAAERQRTAELQARMQQMQRASLDMQAEVRGRPWKGG